MKIIIDIDKDLYEGIEKRDGALEMEYVCDELMKAIENGTPLPDNPTNGDIILALNETAQVYGIELDEMNKTLIKVCVDGVRVQFFDYDWWNAPYEKESD